MDQDYEREQLMRQRQMAALLQQQGQAPQGQMVSGRYVAPSWTQYLASGLSNYRGQQMNTEADKKQKAMAEALQQRKDAWLQSMPQDKPAETMDAGSIDPSMASVGPIETAPAKNASSDDYLMWALKGMQVDPQAAQLGMKMADRQEGRQMQQEQAKVLREQRMQELMLRMQDARLSAQERQQAQQEAARLQREFMAEQARLSREQQAAMAKFQAAMRPEPAPSLTTIQDPKDPAKSVVVDARTGRHIGTAPPKEGQTSPASKVRDAEEALALIADAEKIVDNATGSYGGVAMDAVAQTFGKATEGAKAAAQLKAVEGMLVSKMPKMSGPQSDKDVLLYRQMAASIGDPTIPREQKKAALQTVKEIQKRYAGIGNGATESFDAPPDAPKFDASAVDAELRRRGLTK